MKAGKAGEWAVQEDGSGTWTRWDKGARRFSTLYSSGPARQDCHTRTTYDSNTGELLETLRKFDTAKLVNEPLPPPVPRDIKSVFHFVSSSKARSQGSVAAAGWRPSLRPRRD